MDADRNGKQPEQPRRQVLGKRYVLWERLGGGGMAEVWKGWDHDAKQDYRPVAIKWPIQHENPDIVSRFYREARAHVLLKEVPSIVHMHGFEHPEGQPPYLVLELLSSDTLKTLLPACAPDRRRPDRLSSGLQSSLALYLAKTAVEAVKAMHDKNLAHRDLKPSNFLLDRDAEQVRKTQQAILKLGDLGIVHDPLSEGLQETQPGNLVGTWAYAPPEYLQELMKERDASRDLESAKRGDIYALGLIFYELWTGQPLLRDPVGASASTSTSKRAQVALDKLREALKSVGSEGLAQTPDMQRLIQEMLSFQPKDRPSLTEVLERLSKQTASAPAGHTYTGSGPAAPSQQILADWKEWRRSEWLKPVRLMMLGGFGILVVLALVGVWGLLGNSLRPMAEAVATLPEHPSPLPVSPSASSAPVIDTAPEPVPTQTSSAITAPTARPQPEVVLKPAPEAVSKSAPEAAAKPKESAQLTTWEALPASSPADREFVNKLRAGKLRPVASGKQDAQSEPRYLVIHGSSGAGLTVNTPVRKVAHSTNTVLLDQGITIAVLLRHGDSNYYTQVKGFREEPEWKQDYNAGQPLGNIWAKKIVTQALIYSATPITSWGQLKGKSIQYVDAGLIWGGKK